MYNSGWSNFGLERLSSDKLVHRGREILEMMKRRGIRPPPSNRLERAIRITDAANDDFSAGRPLSEGETDRLLRLKEAWRTIWEALVVMHAVVEKRASSSVITNELLASFLEGANLPTEDANSSARNRQFEAVTCANLIHSGLTLSPGEPDCRFVQFGETVGVAVKRLTSVKPQKVHDELRDAAGQLRRSQLRGYVALSLDNWIDDLGSSDDSEVVGARFNEQLTKAHEQLDAISERPLILGAFVSVSWSTWRFGGDRPALEWRMPQQIRCFTEDLAQVARQRELFEPARRRWEATMAQIGSLVAMTPAPPV